MSMLRAFGVLLLVGLATFLTLYVTFVFVRRWRQGDRSLRSFGAWLRDLFDVVSGLG
jgi:hypothetical protein